MISCGAGLITGGRIEFEDEGPSVAFEGFLTSCGTGLIIGEKLGYGIEGIGGTFEGFSR